MMSTVQQRYRKEKPKNCKYCYFWENKACIRGVENCYYLIKESSKIKSECMGCPYKKASPCLGHCTQKILKELHMK